MGMNVKGGRWGSFLNLLLLLILLALAAFWFWRHWGFPPVSPHPSPASSPASSPLFRGDPNAATEQLISAINGKLQRLDLLKLLSTDVKLKFVNIRGKVFPEYTEEFRLPSNFNQDQLAGELSEAAKGIGARYDPFFKSARGESGEALYLFPFDFDQGWLPLLLVFRQIKAPRLCLIIDDAGYQKGEVLKGLYNLKIPVTVSIIPGAPFSKGLAKEFPYHGVEVMCHMPMEGHEKGMVGTNYKEFLKKGMSTVQVKAELDQALSDLPNCRGLNNHMGSVATEDVALMSELCQDLKSKNLYIIDSRTTANSMVEKTAKKAGLPVAGRNIFLDNVENPEAILKQLEAAETYAKKHGFAVAIGHFKPITLQTLESAIPEIKNEGIQFVFASEIVKEE